MPTAPRIESSGNRVSVVIAAYNHAIFLQEAIDSARRQSHDDVEVVVIDDGSTDGTAQLVRDYPDVRYRYQPNRGSANARNAGLRQSTGRYVIFLDADDRLLPTAAEVGLAHLRAAEHCAFVSGEHRYIDRAGCLSQTWTREPVAANHHVALLQGNYIGMIATVMFRRQVLELVGGFDPRWRACEDYDLYLRITRGWQVAAHNVVVAEYRRYGTATSDNLGLMLETALSVLRNQQNAAWSAGERQAWRRGLEYWKNYYGPGLAERVQTHLLSRGHRRQAIRELALLATHAPAHLPRVFDRFARR